MIKIDLSDIAASLRTAAATLLICCVLYTAAVLAFAQAVAPAAAEGSLIRNDQGVVIGSTLIAQRFTLPRHLWPRPSVTEYDASAAAGSNLSPANPALRTRVLRTLARLASDAQASDAQAREAAAPAVQRTGPAVPADLVTASGSGLDPHITIAAARFQAPRIARACGCRVRDVLGIIDACAEPPLIAGDTLVNVLRVNLALDRMEVRHEQ